MVLLDFFIGALALIIILGIAGLMIYFLVMLGIFVIRVPHLLERIAESLEDISMRR